METLDDLDSQHAASISKEAVRLMSELNIPVIPTNFTVWFAYVLGRSPALRKTIDILRSNQRTFDKSVSRELYSTFLRSNSLVNAGQALSIFLIDVDRFKAFNDKYGHQLGDQVLRLVAQCVRETIQEADFSARFGGEELMCVLPGTSISTCKEIAERARKRTQ